MENGLQSPQQVADHLGIPLQTLYGWRTKGTAPRAVKVGKHLRFRPEDVRAWIESHTDNQRSA